MDLIKRFHGRAERQAPNDASPPQPAAISIYGDRIVQIDNLGLMGVGTRSPDGRLLLVCGSLYTAESSGGRDGAYAVIGNKTILASGHAERPQEGRIADNGVFVFNDWLHGGHLNGRFMAFDADGRTIIAQHFEANLNGNGLSANGRYAVCQTLNAPGSPDSNVVAVFDLAEARELARFQPMCGTARNFAFDEEAGLVHLITNDGDRETYDVTSGAMHDPEAWRARRIAAGDLAVIGALLKDTPALDGAMAVQVGAGLRAAQANDDGWRSARAYRIEGEWREAQSRPAEALEAYEQALTRDPQAGVAKRADALRRAQSGPARKLSQFAQQAARVGIAHEQIILERGDAKAWRHQADDPYTPVELAALAHYEREGWSGCAAEGGLMLTLLKAASFPKLDPQNADTFVEALYYRQPGWPNAHIEPEQHVANVKLADLARIARNWVMISATAGDTPAHYPRVTWPHVQQLFVVLGADRLAAIAQVFATAPYDLRAAGPISPCGATPMSGSSR